MTDTELYMAAQKVVATANAGDVDETEVARASRKFERALNMWCEERGILVGFSTWVAVSERALNGWPLLG